MRGGTPDAELHEQVRSESKETIDAIFRICDDDTRRELAAKLRKALDEVSDDAASALADEEDKIDT